MATYTFRDKETEEVADYIMSVHEYDDFKKTNPNLERILFPIATISRYHGSTGKSMKPADGFREVLRQIKTDHKGSKIETF